MEVSRGENSNKKSSGPNWQNPDLQQEFWQAAETAAAQEINRKYLNLARQDFSYPGEIYQQVRRGEVRGVSFNYSGLPYPLPCAHAAAELVHAREAENKLSQADRAAIIAEARCLAAQSGNVSDPRSIVLCPNATTANVLALALFRLQASATSFVPGTLVTSNIEYSAVNRALEIICDPTNLDGRDPLSTFSNWNGPHGKTALDIPFRLSGLNAKELPIYGKKWDEIRPLIEREAQFGMTKGVIISHVERDTGRILPVEELVRIFRQQYEKNPYTKVSRPPFIMIDGAQALGNIPRVDIPSLECDSYAVSAPKAFGSEPLGWVYLNLKSELVNVALELLNSVSMEEVPILDGMFDPSLGIKSNTSECLNVADLAGYIAAIKYHQENGCIGNDFSLLDSKRKILRDYFLQSLEQLGQELDFKIVTPELDMPSNFILSFRFFGMPRQLYRPMLFARCDAHSDWIDYPPGRRPPGYEIVRRLAQKGVFLAYLDQSAWIRASFRSDQSLEDVDFAMERLKEVLSEPDMGPYKLSRFDLNNQQWDYWRQMRNSL